jgi:methionyl-tRNA formyltransferase
VRLVFIGCVQFSAACLAHMVTSAYEDVEIVGVVTRHDSSNNADFQSLVPLARAHNLPLFCADRRDQAALAEWLGSRAPDIVFCLGWSTLLQGQVLRIPRLGVVGYHPTALPRNRGRHPLIWSLALGLKETASTFFLMDEGVDSGDILSQQLVPIDEDENAGSLYRKLTLASLRQLTELIPRLVDGSVKRTPQDHARATYWRKRTKADGQIDWRMPARNIANLVRALSPPYPGAHCLHLAEEVRIWKAEVFDISGSEHLEPGKVVETARDGLIVKCGVDGLKITEHEFHRLPERGAYL